MADSQMPIDIYVKHQIDTGTAILIDWNVKGSKHAALSQEQLETIKQMVDDALVILGALDGKQGRRGA